MRDEDLDVKILKRNGSITYTTDCEALQRLLKWCQDEKVKIRVYKYPFFISIVLR